MTPAYVRAFCPISPFPKQAKKTRPPVRAPGGAVSVKEKRPRPPSAPLLVALPPPPAKARARPGGNHKRSPASFHPKRKPLARSVAGAGPLRARPQRPSPPARVDRSRAPTRNSGRSPPQRGQVSPPARYFFRPRLGTDRLKLDQVRKFLFSGRGFSKFPRMKTCSGHSGPANPGPLGLGTPVAPQRRPGPSLAGPAARPKTARPIAPLLP